MSSRDGLEVHLMLWRGVDLQLSLSYWVSLRTVGGWHVPGTLYTMLPSTVFRIKRGARVFVKLTVVARVASKEFSSFSCVSLRCAFLLYQYLPLSVNSFVFRSLILDWYLTLHDGYCLYHLLIFFLK